MTSFLPYKICKIKQVPEASPPPPTRPALEIYPGSTKGMKPFPLLKTGVPLTSNPVSALGLSMYHEPCGLKTDRTKEHNSNYNF